MIKNNQNNPVTKKELVEVLGTFTEDVLLPAMEHIMDEKIDTKLSQHTHEMKAYIDSKLSDQKGDIIEYIKGEHTDEMKRYIDSTLDSKLADQKGDIISVVKGDRERDKSWKLKNLDILKRNKLANPKELELLADFAR
ncbi:hypothetical protein COU00_00605 [Candidatus Falkowbacteria bacterium CG10_big_fil_rev_8_21_14_0_10_43_11]|uniref:Uncharacterized protein n=1 Tax=Candidatus Falkowbacteria bacterium CG10_big_fil_rev_8_21_14_0_10_43_11 TaxID=1974568 RepID=A0A2M6WN21_9BACT|nr:MAG: hypothetical protein COU00_00605 [Candidatus Falkowbacteria bacterium CG10_big_fil_rev_8_21_14_0_10_43_11]